MAIDEHDLSDDDIHRLTELREKFGHTFSDPMFEKWLASRDAVAASLTDEPGGALFANEPIDFHEEDLEEDQLRRLAQLRVKLGQTFADPMFDRWLKGAHPDLDAWLSEEEPTLEDPAKEAVDFHDYELDAEQLRNLTEMRQKYGRTFADPMFDKWLKSQK